MVSCFHPSIDCLSFLSASHLTLRKGAGSLHSMGLPIHVYPLYENARRAHQKQSCKQNWQESAEMYAKFDDIASKNEYAWNYGEPTKSAEQIGTVTKRNRLICQPCMFFI